MLEIVIGTRNKDKIREIKELLSDLDIKVYTGFDFPLVTVIEDGDSFVSNSLKKARIYSDASGKIALSDDSGLMVYALDGRPGVHSARYAGENATYKDNIEKLLREMEGIKDRRAKFVCVVSIVTPEGREYILSGELHGVILEEMRGENGFGYDPVFYIPELGKTLAEIPLEEKNKISHRAKAFTKAKKILEGFLK